MHVIVEGGQPLFDAEGDPEEQGLKPDRAALEAAINAGAQRVIQKNKD